jgi:Fe-S cluster biogenesis protein NfuA
MGKKGDAQFDYDTVEMQEIKFKELIDSNMLPTVVEEGGSRMLTKFEPDVDEVIWIPKVMGG